MGENSTIEWCDHTFNPWIGCAKVSPGCANCYAEVETYPRVQRARGRELWGPAGDRHITSEENWMKPFKWDREAARDGVRRRVFCASLADVFEDREGLEEPRTRLFDLIAQTANLDWLLLTKRPENFHKLIIRSIKRADAQRNFNLGNHLNSWSYRHNAPDNIWIGCTVENQEMADRRLPELLKIPAAVRFLSCEPLLGPVEFSDVTRRSDAVYQLGKKALDGIHWVICGGESGPNARPMHPDWARSLRDQCVHARIPFHFKQWGEFGPSFVRASTGDPVFAQFENMQQWINHASWINGGICVDAKGVLMRRGLDFEAADYPVVIMHKLGKKRSGRIIDGLTWNELPEVMR